MGLNSILALMTFTFKESIRAKWVLIYTAVFFLLAINIPMIVLITARYLPPDYLEIYLSYLVTLSFPFLPLLALPLGAMSIVDERENGILEHVLSNPISRLEYLFGKFLGLLVATTTVVVSGYMIAAFLSYGAEPANMAQIIPIITVAAGLNVIMLLLGLLISIGSKRKTTALMIGLFFWFLLTVISDIGTLGMLLSLGMGGHYVVALAILNPIESARLMAVLSMSNIGPTELGNIGLILKATLGSTYIPVLLLGSQLVWISILMIICITLFVRMEII